MCFVKKNAAIMVDFLGLGRRAKDVYRAPSKILENPDAIVIGSGIGGLGLASLLTQRRGMKVLVLEANDVPGGCTHVHELGNFEFNTGIHSIGDMADGTPTRNLLDSVTQGQLGWARMPEIHEVCTFGDEVYNWHSSPEANVEEIARRMPGEGDARKYYALEDKIAKQAAPWGLTKLYPEWIPTSVREALYRATAGPWRRYMQKSALEVLQGELGFSERLTAAYSYMYGNYGRVPAKVPFSLHAIVLAHYRMGAFYPVGGPAQFAESTIPIIENGGGQVAVSAPVERILVEKGRAAGVRLKSGQEIRAKVTFSDASAYTTFTQLLPQDVSAEHGYIEKMSKMQPSPPHFFVMLGYDKAIDLPQHIIWHMPQGKGVSKYDIGAADAQFRSGTNMDAMACYFLSPSARDPLFSQRYPNKSTLIALTEMPWLEECARSDSKKKDIEGRLTETMMGLVHQYYPQLKNERPALVHAAAPVGCNPTSWQGSSYGLAVTPERYLRDTHWLRPATTIPGLYLSGQDALSPGFAGALGGAAMAYAVYTGDWLCLVKGFAKPSRALLTRKIASARSDDAEAA